MSDTTGGTYKLAPETIKVIASDEHTPAAIHADQVWISKRI